MRNTRSEDNITIFYYNAPRQPQWNNVCMSKMNVVVKFDGILIVIATIQNFPLYGIKQETTIH